MNFITKTIIGLGIALSAIATFNQSSLAEQRFVCDEEQQITLLRSHWGDIPLINYLDSSFPPPWTPVERCRAITARFNKFHDNGTLKYLRAGRMYNYPVICVAAYKGGSCLPNGILITLKYGSDPNLVFTRIVDRRMWATSDSIYLESGDDYEIISEVNGTVYFDIESLLDEK